MSICSTTAAAASTKCVPYTSLTDGGGHLWGHKAGAGQCQSHSSWCGYMGCRSGMTDFLCVSRAMALRMSSASSLPV